VRLHPYDIFGALARIQALQAFWSGRPSAAPEAPNPRVHTFTAGCNRQTRGGLDLVSLTAISDDTSGAHVAEIVGSHIDMAGGVPPVSGMLAADDVWDGHHLIPATVQVSLGNGAAVALTINADGTLSVADS
jgi:hypothetical protein